MEQLWGAALGRRSSFEEQLCAAASNSSFENRSFGEQLWGLMIFGTQLWGAAFGSNFGEQLSGAALEHRFGERTWGTGLKHSRPLWGNRLVLWGTALGSSFGGTALGGAALGAALGSSFDHFAEQLL